MLAVPVTLRCRAGKSACGTRILTCSVRATGCVQDLQASIKDQLQEDEHFAEMLYRGSRPAIESPLQDFIADKSLPSRFQASYRGIVDLDIKLPDGKSLCISVRAGASLVEVMALLEAFLGHQQLQSLCLMTRHPETGLSQSTSPSCVQPGCTLELVQQWNLTITLPLGTTLVQCWPTDETQMVIDTLRFAGCYSTGQRLMLGSKRLEAFKSLADSGVRDGAVLQLAPADGSSFIIRMMTMNSQQLQFEVLPTTSFKIIIAATAQHFGLPANQLRFTCFGKRLCDWDRLGEFGLGDGDTVDMFEEQLGGGGGPCMFADVSNSDTLEKQAFSTSAPVWRVAGPGLNVEGKCCNAKCEAHGHLVIANQGMCSFSLLQDKARCLRCFQIVQAETCAFVGCAWLFDGRKLGPDGSITCCSSDWQAATSDGYHRTTEEGNMVAWESLIICTRPSSVAEDAPCPICWDQISADKSHLTGCKHAFHTDCLAAWQQYASPATCPLCRGSLAAGV